MDGPTLTDFAEEHGTTDRIGNSNPDTANKAEKESQDSNPKPELPLDGAVDDKHILPDRHVPLSEIPEYWEANRNAWNIIPKGAFSIIFDSTCCQHGWPVDAELRTGVYLRGRHTVNPPAPVEVDDDLLAAAATTAAQAAHKIVSDHDLTDAPVIGLTKECATSLSIYLDSSIKPRQRTVYSNSHDTPLSPTIPETDKSPPLFHGFTKVRLFNKSSSSREHPGHEIYTDAEQPRLSLSDIGWTSMLNNSLSALPE